MMKHLTVEIQSKGTNTQPQRSGLVATIVMTMVALSVQPTFAGGFGGVIGDVGEAISHLNPGNPNTVIRSGDLAPHPTSPSVSTIQVVVSPQIDDNGNIWSGSGSGGGRGQIVGRANLDYDANGNASWKSDYGNNYGRVQNRRASQYDRRPVPNVSQQPPQQSQQQVTTQQRIDWQAGIVFEGTFVNGQLVSERPVARAQIDRRVDPQTGVIFEGQHINGQLISERPVGRAW